MYTTQERVEAFLNRELTQNEVSLLDEIIESVSDTINQYCSRSWFPVDADDEEDDYTEEARLFDGTGSKTLFIDDFISISQIKINDRLGGELGTWSNADNWILGPNNKNPKTSIYLKTGRFNEGIGNIEITGVWGAGNPPKGVVMACTQLVGKFLQKSNNGTSQFKKESIEGYSYELMSGAEIDADTERIMSTLGVYRRILL